MRGLESSGRKHESAADRRKRNAEEALCAELQQDENHFLQPEEYAALRSDLVQKGIFQTEEEVNQLPRVREIIAQRIYHFTSGVGISDADVDAYAAEWAALGFNAQRIAELVRKGRQAAQEYREAENGGA